METTKLQGLILSGGKSRRMGQDKGLIVQDSLTWINKAGKILQDVRIPVSVMIREAQRSAYEDKILPEFELLTDLDLPVGGPLRGLLSFHQTNPLCDVVVLPADMPDMTAVVVRELREFCESLPDAMAWVFLVDGVVQPFPGIYSARFLADITEKVERQEIRHFGLMRLLESANTAHKIFGGSDFVFKNYNYPQGLAPIASSRSAN